MKQKKLSGKALVIQLGRDEVRVALMTLGAAPKIQQCMALPVPPGTVEDGVIQDPEVLRDTLKAALGAPEYRRRKRVVFSICSTQIIPETVTVPALSPKKMEKLLTSNMDLYFPVEAQEYHMVWKLIGETAGGEGGKEASVQLWAVPNTLLAGYYALANSCGLSVAAIDYCGNSLAAAVGADFSAAAKTARPQRERGEKKRVSRRRDKETGGLAATAVMDPPETQEAEALPDTTLYLLAEREYLMMTFVQAGQVKLQRLLLCGADPEGALSEALMVLEYYSSMEAGRYSDISGVLCGALAEEPVFLRTVEEMLDLPVQVLDCAQGPAWCICLGAARTVLDFGVPAMDQRGGAGRQLAQAWQYGLVLVGGALLAASLLLTFGSRANRRIALDGLKATAQSLELQAAKNAGNADRYRQYETDYNAYGADWDTLFGTEDTPGALRTYNDNLVLALEELEDTLPKTTRVVTIGIAAQGLGLQLACESKEDVAYTIIALRDLQYATLGAISNLSYGSGLDARQVLSALTGVSEADLAAALGGSTGTGETQQPAEEAPTEGGQLDITSLIVALQQPTDYQSLLQQAISSGSLTGADLEAILGQMGGSQQTPNYQDILQQAVASGNLTQKDLEAILGQTSSGQTGTQPSDYYQSVLQQAIASGGFTQKDLENALEQMDPSQIELLEEMYGKTPATDWTLEELLADATFSQRKAAMRTMLTEDPVAKYRFFEVLKADIRKPSGTEILFDDIADDLWEDAGFYMGAFSGDTASMEKILPDLLDIITGDQKTLSETERLIMTDDPALAERLAYYLAVEMGRQKDNAGLGSIDIDELMDDIINGTLPNMPGRDDAAGALAGVLPTLIPDVEVAEELQMQEWFKNYLLGGDTADDSWDVVWALLGEGDVSPGAEIDPSENAEYSLDDKYYITVALKYKEDLIRAELARKGLSYDDKAAKLEVDG